MEIALDFTHEQWQALNLKDTPEDAEKDAVEQGWQVAVDVLKDRLYSRYIDPVDALLSAEADKPAKERRFGFTILAIDLLLMETIQAFKEGLEDTNGKSKAVFKRFLEQSPHFAEYFPTDDHRESFYKKFRCGILHQAEIQSGALLWSIGELYERADDMEVANRTRIHEALKADLDDYLAALRNPDNVELRMLFKKKMDAVANRA
ncbi:hypothetical protein KUH14_004426 [Vibrio parahaemolyticus]|nr:hypothetical protein [Vibrio parahaemolyticus]EHR0831253.1 hypothetical protein [Vibrio parahaemolyticus]EHR1158878.1 hypothetical protein [Vibrio parahaemolyticus]EHR5011053.1 hypothetical protein [Vibrio parahaemolyticus]ELA8170783.1 hypothetical protein [Vibrio parahaemolyticus]